VGLASDAAENIIDARPIDSMSELAGVSQVGEAALEALRDYVSQGGG
jgi:DNA uptake protein ComE-like DNA-binding protein